MTKSGNRQAATALANWHQQLPEYEQRSLTVALRTNPDSLGGDLRRNFQQGLLDPGQLKQHTVNLLRQRFGISFAFFDGGLMSTLKFRPAYQHAFA